MSINEVKKPSHDGFDLLMRGYRLTTAEILYHMPDHPSVLQSYIWQELDLAPKFPVLTNFLNFWEENLDGPLHSIKMATTGIISARELRHADFDLSVH